MISFILGLSFSFEAAALALAEPFIIKRAVFNGVNPGLILYVGFFAIVFFVLGQICFIFTRKKYGIESILEHPWLGFLPRREEEPEPVMERIIDGSDIAEIQNGEIIFANTEAYPGEDEGSKPSAAGDETEAAAEPEEDETEEE